jgi:hypothetical protein
LWSPSYTGEERPISPLFDERCSSLLMFRGPGGPRLLLSWFEEMGRRNSAWKEWKERDWARAAGLKALADRVAAGKGEQANPERVSPWQVYIDRV